MCWRESWICANIDLKRFLFPLWTCQHFHLITIWLKVIHQATYLEDNTISAMKKDDLVQQIINLRGIDIVNWSSKPGWPDFKFIRNNHKISNIKPTNLKTNEKRVIHLEKNLAESEQYSRGSNVEFR